MSKDAASKPDPENLYEMLDRHPEKVLAWMYWGKFSKAYRVAFHDGDESKMLEHVYGMDKAPLRRRVLGLYDGYRRSVEDDRTDARRAVVVADVVTLFADELASDLVFSPPGLFSNQTFDDNDPRKKLPELLDPQPGEVLSLMYWVKHHTAYRVAFHAAPEDAMTLLFGIRDSALQDEVLGIRQKYLKTLDPHATEEQRKEVVADLVKLFANHVARDLVYGSPVFW